MRLPAVSQPSPAQCRAHIHTHTHSQKAHTYCMCIQLSAFSFNTHAHRYTQTQTHTNTHTHTHTCQGSLWSVVCIVGAALPLQWPVLESDLSVAIQKRCLYKQQLTEPVEFNYSTSLLIFSHFTFFIHYCCAVYDLFWSHVSFNVYSQNNIFPQTSCLISIISSFHCSEYHGMYISIAYPSKK